MGAETKIEWTRGDDGTPGATWNPLVGCDKVSAGCDNCLAPESRVLMEDGSWRPIKDLVVGDRLLAYDEAPPLGENRLLRTSIVEAVWKTAAATVTITTQSGQRVTGSANHLWLCSVRPWFRPAERLHLGVKLRSMGDPDSAADLTDPDYQAGYVAGVTAGDGTMRWDPNWRSNKKGFPQMYWRVAMLTSDRAVLDRLVSYLQSAGITRSSVKPFANSTKPDSSYMPRSGSPAPMSKVEHRAKGDISIIASMLEEREAPGWKAGWLAGFLDTDGSADGKSVRWSQTKPNDYLERTVRYVQELGYRAKLERPYRERRTVRLEVENLNERVQFLGTILPALPRKSMLPYLGTRFAADEDSVVGVVRGPVQELVDITTSTRTFIAEGLATHNCYAETLVNRFAGSSPAFPNTFDVVSLRDEKFLHQPLRWSKARRIFVNSLSDLFHKDVPDQFIAQVFAVMAASEHHTFQMLTKRHGRMRSLMNSEAFVESVRTELQALFARGIIKKEYDLAWPLPNLWLGVSVEDQSWADTRIPALLETPAVVRWISAEPLLGPVDLTAVEVTRAGESEVRDVLRAVRDERGEVLAPGLDWIVVGGESGAGARAMDADWARALRDQCAAAQADGEAVAFLMKQAGNVLAREWGCKDRKGTLATEWPEQFPREYPR